MLKLKINARELKTITEKVICNVEKSKIEILECIKIESKENTLYFSTTNMERFLTVKTDNYIPITDGTICINNKDFSLLLKMKNEIELTEQDGVLLVRNGNKTLKMKLQDVESFPEFPKEEVKNVLKMPESELAEVLKNLYSWTHQDGNRPTMTCYNFNLQYKRVEALDGFRIGMKSFDADYIIDADTKSFTLQNKAHNSLKKAISEKGSNIITLGINEKYVSIIGKDFEFYNRKIDGEYFDVQKTLPMEHKHSFEVNTEELKQITQYNVDLLKKSDNKSHMLFYGKENTLQTYFRTEKFETIDKINAENLSIDKELLIAFNPIYITEALKLADTEQVRIELCTNISPMMMYADKYSFLVLPVRITESVDNIVEKLEQNRAA